MAMMTRTLLIRAQDCRADMFQASKAPFIGRIAIKWPRKGRVWQTLDRILARGVERYIPRIAPFLARIGIRRMRGEKRVALANGKMYVAAIHDVAAERPPPLSV
jgi:hypothetical protein